MQDALVTLLSQIAQPQEKPSDTFPRGSALHRRSTNLRGLNPPHLLERGTEDRTRTRAVCIEP